MRRLGFECGGDLRIAGRGDGGNWADLTGLCLIGRISRNFVRIERISRNAEDAESAEGRGEKRKKLCKTLRERCNS